MKKTNALFLIILTFFSSTLNVFAETIEVFEEKTETINKENYESLKNDIEQKVYQYNQQQDGYVYDYEISIKEEKDEVIITDTKKITSEKKFTSEAEAKKYYEDYKLEDSWKQGELTITSKQEDIVVNGDTITITCEDAACTKEISKLEEALNEYEELEVISKNTKSKNDIKKIIYSIEGKEQELKYEDALKLIVTLNPKIEGYKLVKNESILVKKGSIEAKTFKDIMGKDTYETYEEAKTAADKFLNDKNYEDKVAVIIAVYDESEKEISKKESIGFLNEEFAWTAAIAQATAELEQAITNGELKLAKTLEETKAALEKAYETGKLGLTGMELDGKIVYYSLPELRVKESAETYTKTFYTKTAAELAKAALEVINETTAETGISIEDIILTETGENVTLIEETKEIPKASYGVLTPNLFNYYSLKNGNTVVIWTEEALTAEQKEEISKSQKELNPKIEKIEFITGFNNEYTVAGIGTFTFKKETKIITIPMLRPPFTHTKQEVNSYSLVLSNGKNTKLTAGYTTTGKKYELSYKQVTSTELWYYDRTEVKFGFDYTVQGGGATIARDLFKVQSILVGKIYDHTMAYRVNNINTYTAYIASFDIFKEITKTKAVVEYKITRKKISTEEVKPDDEIEDEVDNEIVEDETTDNEIIEDETTETDKDNEVNEDETGNVIPDTEEEITPPNTGAKINLVYESLLVLMLLSAIISLKKQCK